MESPGPELCQLRRKFQGCVLAIRQPLSPRFYDTLFELCACSLSYTVRHHWSYDTVVPQPITSQLKVQQNEDCSVGLNFFFSDVSAIYGSVSRIL